MRTLSRHDADPDVPTHWPRRDLDDTTPGEPGHPAALALIIECADDLARIVIPASVWPPRNASFSRLTDRLL